MNKILIIGTIPATAGIGGVTIHVQRLEQYLASNSPGICDFLDYKQAGVIKILKIIRKYKYIHLHFSNSYIRLIITIWANLFKTKVITTFHGNYSKLKPLKRIILIITLKLTFLPIFINQSSYDSCILHNPRSVLLPAFIPPVRERPFDYRVKSIIDKVLASGKRLVSTNASALAFDENGNEIYGIKFLINYFSKQPDTILLISDPSGQNRERYGRAYSNILYIDFPHDYYEILKRASLFIRNTSTDGDSISVKESLYIGCRTICSDVIDRPTGCFLFHYNDADSLKRAIASALKAEIAPISMENGAVRLTALYKKLIS